MGKKPRRVSGGEEAKAPTKAQKDPPPDAFDTHRLKKPMNAYILFTQDKRAGVKERHPDLKSKEIVRFIGKMWNDCGEEEKRKYTERAEQQKELYRKHLEEHGPSKAKKEKDTRNGPPEDKKRRTTKPHRVS